MELNLKKKKIHAFELLQSPFTFRPMVAVVLVTEVVSRGYLLTTSVSRNNFLAKPHVLIIPVSFSDCFSHSMRKKNEPKFVLH